MGFQDSVSALPSYFFTTFLKKFYRGESLWTTTCFITVVGGKQGYAPCRVLLLHKASFCVSRMSMKSHGCHENEVSPGHPHFWGYLRIEDSGVCLY